MESGSVRKYLLYAIGEILLVMIGILLALQVNNWNESRKSKNQELAYITRIQSDISADTANLKIFLNLVQHKKIFLLSILTGRLKKFTFVEEGGGYDIFISRFRALPNVRDDAYIAMVNSGAFNIIQNEKLKESILNYYRFVDNRVESLSSKFSEWPKVISSMIDGESEFVDGGLGFNKNEEIFISEAAQKTLINKIITEKEILRPHINAELQFTNKQKVSYEALLLRANEVLQDLDKEIKLRSK